MRHVHVKAKHVTRSYTEEITRSQYEGCAPKTNKSLVLTFPFPSGTIYPSTHGNLITCKYYLVIECDIPMAFDLESKPDIVIALLPAAGQVVNLYTNYTKGGWN